MFEMSFLDFLWIFLKGILWLVAFTFCAWLTVKVIGYLHKVITYVDGIPFDFLRLLNSFISFNKSKEGSAHKLLNLCKIIWVGLTTAALLYVTVAIFYSIIKYIDNTYVLAGLFAFGISVATLLTILLRKFEITIFQWPTSSLSIMFASLYKLIQIDAYNDFVYAIMFLTGSVVAYVSSYIYLRDFKENPKRTAVGPDDSSDRDYVAKPARYSFKDVAGMEDLKKSMLKAGMEIIGKSKSVHGKVKNGILFFGLPGNGKTFFAEALAGELKIKFLAASFGDVASMWVGETTQRAMKIFDDAEAQAPCMLFFDEIDSVFVDRGSVKNADSEAPKTLNAILTRLVDIRNKGVVVVGATNYLEKLDTASIREGRFDYKIEVKNPDYEARKALLQRGLKGLSVSDDVLESIATRWEGYSVSRIMSIADKAKENAYEHSQKSLGFDDLMKALRDVQGSKGDSIPESVPAVDKLFLTEAMRHRMNNIIERMKHIDQIEKFGGNAPTGILLSGPPGTGKTLGAMVLAKTCGWSFIQTTGNSLIGNPDEIDKLMQRASDIRPCVLFIDEADDVLADRNGSMSKSVTNRLLSVMDGAKGKPKDVLFVAATNYPDLIDDAMLRGGRFTEKIEFSLPDLSVLRDYIAKWIEQSKAPLSLDFTVDNVSQMLRGQSLANVKVILQASINESITRLSRDANATVGLDDVESAMQLIAS